MIQILIASCISGLNQPDLRMPLPDSRRKMVQRILPLLPFIRNGYDHLVRAEFQAAANQIPVRFSRRLLLTPSQKEYHKHRCQHSIPDIFFHFPSPFSHKYLDSICIIAGMSSGFARCAVIPAAFAAATSSAKASAVIAMIGTVPASGRESWRIAFVA